MNFKVSRVITAALLVWAGTASADQLRSVPPMNQRCAEYGCVDVHWHVTGLPRVRIVAFGYEDGISYTMYEETPGKELRLLFRFIPYTGAHPTESAPFLTTRTYAVDLPLFKLKGQVCLEASFEMPLEPDKLEPYPKWQRQVPIIKFSSKASAEAPERWSFQCMTLAQLVRQARATARSSPTNSR